jgi:phosphohistidine phosphatase
MADVPSHFYVQSAALPYRVVDSQIEILLVTSRRKKRWVLPKGVVEPGMSPAESAAKEAWEEAGIEGDVSPRTLGSYTYEKWSGVCTVQVFPLQVRRLAETWPEDSRDRRWYGPDEAARKVDEPELRRILSRSETLLRSEDLG